MNPAAVHATMTEILQERREIHIIDKTDDLRLHMTERTSPIEGLHRRLRVRTTSGMISLLTCDMTLAYHLLRDKHPMKKKGKATMEFHLRELGVEDRMVEGVHLWGR
jgi:hypothetical protein